MTANAFGFHPLLLGERQYLLEIDREGGMLLAWLYPIEAGAVRPSEEAHADRDTYALDLAPLGEDGDHGWYDLPDDEVVANIVGALGMAEIEVELQSEWLSALEFLSIDVIRGIAERMVAGYRMGVFLQRTLDVFSGDRDHLVCRLEEALATYRTATGADLSGKLRPIPWTFGGPDEEEGA